MSRNTDKPQNKSRFLRKPKKAIEDMTDGEYKDHFWKRAFDVRKKTESFYSNERHRLVVSSILAFLCAFEMMFFVHFLSGESSCDFGFADSTSSDIFFDVFLAMAVFGLTIVLSTHLLLLLIIPFTIAAFFISLCIHVLLETKFSISTGAPLISIAVVSGACCAFTVISRQLPIAAKIVIVMGCSLVLFAICNGTNHLLFLCFFPVSLFIPLGIFIFLAWMRIRKIKKARKTEITRLMMEAKISRKADEENSSEN